ncbi:hypothetical protein GA0070606_0777 [Micromonospora citrea]|uniref:Uncharacterized protein n=1 Tax=Micromonospora citrea TaxID=47855 RepID=A0A1C6TV30_9ACTN|nr:hypothetical protein [Micromonospora citrea]SCL45523.1 hypothetical protein GA0070606_0777 [Micromonospora citrea]
MTETMTNTSPRAPHAGHARPDRPRAALVRHLLEMALAMIAGMVLLGPLRTAVGAAVGLAPAFERPDVGALLMATDMSVGMAVWMRYRRHSWPAVGEMTAAMYLPILVLLVPFEAGLLGADALLVGGHLLMLPAMVLAALRRRDEYARHPADAPAVARHRLVAALARRWPTGLALLLTLEMLLSPAVPPAPILLVLPAAYLVIGAVRGRLGGPRMIALQLAGLVVWSALALAALTVDGALAGWLVAAGWLGHAAWDVAHHRANRVVPRGYAEWCAVFDTCVGLAVVLAVLAR